MFNSKFKFGAAALAVATAITMSACSPSDNQSGQSGQSGTTPTATSAPTHTPSANEQVGESINETNKASGFYSADSKSLNDPASGDFKQITLPSGWESSKTTYMADGNPSTEEQTFEGLDKDAVLKVASNTLINTLDGPRSYALTLPNDESVYKSDMSTQMATIQDGYVDGRFDTNITGAQSLTDASRTALESALASGDDASAKSVFSQDGDAFAIENVFAGPYVPVKGGYSAAALGADYNRIAIDSLDNVAFMRVTSNIGSDEHQPYINAKIGDTLNGVNVRMEITYRIPLLNAEDDEVALSNPLHATVSALVLKDSSGSYVVYYAASKVRTVADDGNTALVVKDSGTKNLETILNPLG